ncbi:MAG TPA: hypothetical protein VHB21_24265, partial [Minicystis sp.]|nr:hypothetical protein [Minicystis sp.]
MHEVGAPAVRLLIEAATRRGIDVTHALEALRAPREALRDPAARFDWDDYVQFIARLEVLAGGAAGMRRLGEDYVHASTELPALLALFDEPMDFFRFVITRYAPAMVTPLVPQFDRLSTDGFRVTVAIEPPYPPSAPLLCALEGALGALPAHTGQAGGEVQADIGEARATFVVR